MITDPLAAAGAIKAIQRVQAQIRNQNISGGSTYTWQIALNRNDYNKGDLAMNIPNQGGKRWRAGYYKFGDTVNEGQGHGPELASNVISLCVYYDRWNGGYAYRNEGKLSSGNWNVGAWPVQLNTIRVNGSNLELVFQNNHATQTAVISLDLEADIWKV